MKISVNQNIKAILTKDGASYINEIHKSSVNGHLKIDYKEDETIEMSLSEFFFVFYSGFFFKENLLSYQFRSLIKDSAFEIEAYQDKHLIKKLEEAIAIIKS